MKKRLNNLLIGKIRHNLKTYLNIICGFSELLKEELELQAYIQDSHLESDLKDISDSGGNIVQEIDQVFSPHNFNLDEFFSQLSSQSISLNGVAKPLLKNIDETISNMKEKSLTGFLIDFCDDVARIENATSDLENSIAKLTKGDIVSIEDLISLEILSQGDIDIVEKFSVSLQETPDALETKYPSNILVVDDNTANTEYLKRKLIASKHSVTVANSGSEAEKFLSNETPIDLILLDILMPGLSGYDVLVRNKELLKNKNIAVIVVSSLDEQDTVYRCLESGAEDYVTKPINFMILAARINSALERKYLLDREEEHLARIELEKQKNEDLLLNILPPSIAARMKTNELLIADSVDQCSILFADIVGFTPLSQTLDAKRIVDMLNKIFSRFDDFCEKLGVEKIKTMGDAYMVASGVPNPDGKHASKMVAVGFMMLDFVNSQPEIFGHKISLRIGIHSGPVVAGVIGKKKFVYDLWGDAVNTACRMESHGIENAIHVSSATAKLINGVYELDIREPIEVKGKGKMQTFIVKQKLDEDANLA